VRGTAALTTYMGREIRPGEAPRETREHAPIGARIRWTLKAGEHMGRNRDEDIVREGEVVGYGRWFEGERTPGALTMDCVQEPRKWPDQTFDFCVPVSSDSWEVIE
jgi:hypothetical protein